jgi:hypothetical protein
MAAVAILTASAQSRPRTAATAVNAVLLDCQGQAQMKLGLYLLACGDGNNYLTALHWTAWGGGTATATGADNVNDCRPNCAVGRFHGYPATVVLDQPRAWAGHPGATHYTRATLHYTGAVPSGLKSTVTVPLPAPAA